MTSPSSLNESEEKALKEILELIVPYGLDLRISDVKGYLMHGFQREKFIEKLLQGARDDPLTSAKLRLIYAHMDIVYRVKKDVNLGEPGSKQV